MKIENMTTKEELSKVFIYLTRSEAAELKDALNAILGEKGMRRHEHVPSSDFQKEITLAIEDT